MHIARIAGCWGSELFKESSMFVQVYQCRIRMLIRFYELKVFIDWIVAYGFLLNLEMFEFSSDA